MPAHRAGALYLASDRDPRNAYQNGRYLGQVAIYLPQILAAGAISQT